MFSFWLSTRPHKPRGLVGRIEVQIRLGNSRKNRKENENEIDVKSSSLKQFHGSPAFNDHFAYASNIAR